MHVDDPPVFGRYHSTDLWEHEDITLSQHLILVCLFDTVICHTRYGASPGQFRRRQSESSSVAFRSVAELETAIRAYIAAKNQFLAIYIAGVIEMRSSARQRCRYEVATGDGSERGQGQRAEFVSEDPSISAKVS